ncbi:hypothetical protein I3842_14G101700 [Carya illinoinensis]|uniref:FAF domain-containing protein n=1 Tax=Carya illinoinensis TaxID=32201 RepID=A0A922ACE6_CARIL|nr:hypothetical protein I3842_14G101700 [Carya illinoinensis]
MAACGSLHHIFENQLQENPTLLESLSSWNQIKPVQTNVQRQSSTEIFGELHFNDNSVASPPSSYSTDLAPQSEAETFSAYDIGGGAAYTDEGKSLSRDSFCAGSSSSSSSTTKYKCHHKSSDSFSSMSSDSLQLCTEGLGFESSDDVEDMRSEMSEDWQNQEEKISTKKNHLPCEIQGGGEFRRSKISVGAFPPPISCISRSGKPQVCFKSYRQDGRFVLKEIRIPTHEFLHACREDGRLKLHFVQPNDEILEEEDEEEEEDEDEADGEEENEDNEYIDGKEDDDGVSNGRKEEK